MARDDVRSRLKALEALAERAGVAVRYESLRVPRDRRSSQSGRTDHVARGGMVRLGERRFILCETTLPLIDKLAVIAEALSSIGIDAIDLPPVLRARIHGTPIPPIPKPRLRLKPIVKVRKTG